VVNRSSIGGALLGVIARPPLPVLRLVGSLPVMGLPETLFFVPTEDCRLALTFDDGPYPDTTPCLLKKLEKHHCQATFFLHGCWAERYPDLVRAIVASGHEIANHTWEDTPSRKLPPMYFRESLNRTHEILAEALAEAGPGQSGIELFRPAGGLPTEEMVSYAASALDYRCVLASVYALDTRVPSPSWIVEAIVRRAHPGAIIVLHEGPGRARVAAIVDEILTRLGASYDVTTASRLLASTTPIGGGD
jgi:peptidoglycan-N-acetylglucosamine deacetylase